MDVKVEERAHLVEAFYKLENVLWLESGNIYLGLARYPSVVTCSPVLLMLVSRLNSLGIFLHVKIFIFAPGSHINFGTLLRCRASSLAKDFSSLSFSFFLFLPSFLSTANL
jgi:hypothetical protein